ncbi:hypothetical protein SUDANB121_00527 [Nocardiopsis dassonvillei]|uniref:hypothetical protein n=1 Tax=Nocardiopsis dassonvillei TaxID=2014 RepID=UPI003F564108
MADGTPPALPGPSGGPAAGSAPGGGLLLATTLLSVMAASLPYLFFLPAAARSGPSWSVGMAVFVAMGGFIPFVLGAIAFGAVVYACFKEEGPPFRGRVAVLCTLTLVGATVSVLPDLGLGSFMLAGPPMARELVVMQVARPVALAAACALGCRATVREAEREGDGGWYLLSVLCLLAVVALLITVPLVLMGAARP